LKRQKLKFRVAEAGRICRQSMKEGGREGGKEGGRSCILPRDLKSTLHANSLIV